MFIDLIVPQQLVVKKNRFRAFILTKEGHF
jgi:hypothetical protein